MTLSTLSLSIPRTLLRHCCAPSALTSESEMPLGRKLQHISPQRRAEAKHREEAQSIP